MASIEMNNCSENVTVGTNKAGQQQTVEKDPVESCEKIESKDAAEKEVLKKDDLNDSDSDSTDDDEEGKNDQKDICGDGGVIKEIIKAGSGWEKPKKGSEVSVHYVGTLTDGTKFDSSRDRKEPFKFKLGEGQVIKGWDKAVETMKKGEICKVTLKPDYAYGKAGSPPKIPADATLVFEIELISWDEEKDLSNDGGVMKKIIQEGEKWDTPNYEARCTVNLKTKGPDGATLEDLREKVIVIGNEPITEGLEKALQSMKKGEHAVVRVSSKYAYGDKGHPQLNIPPGSSLVYDIELKDFVKGKQNWELNSFEEKYDLAVKRKKEGNEFFNSQLYDLALKKYDNALSIFKYASDLKDKQKEVDSLKVDCHLNSAAVELKLGKLKEAIEHANKTLEIDSKNVKALWRRGTAHAQKGDWDLAKKDFEKALEHDPENKSVKSSLAQLKKKIAEEDKKDRARYQNLFQKLAVQEAKEKEKEKGNTNVDRKENVRNEGKRKESKSESALKTVEGATLEKVGNSEIPPTST